MILRTRAPTSRNSLGHLGPLSIKNAFNIGGTSICTSANPELAEAVVCASRDWPTECVCARALGPGSIVHSITISRRCYDHCDEPGQRHFADDRSPDTC